jgi:glycosyltransferase involved in cell wall biosynthesis
MKNHGHVLVTLENILLRGDTGEIYATSELKSLFPYLDETYVVRVKKLSGSELGLNKIVSNSKIVALPCQENTNTILYLWKLFQQLNEISREFKTILITLPGLIGSLLAVIQMTKRRPVFLRLVGDPYLTFQSQAVNTRFRVIARIALTIIQKMACKQSFASAYVTQSYLQSKYPPGKRTRIHAISDVRIERVHQAIVRPKNPNLIRLCTVSSLEQPYKSVDVIIRSIPILKEFGINAELLVIGEGKLRMQLEKVASTLTPNKVIFMGTFPTTDQVIKYIRKEADIFVLASRTEGLPRAMIEAMSAGLPCIGTGAGGMSELLNPDFVFKVGSHEDLALKIYKLLREDKYFQESMRGLEIASKYKSTNIENLRGLFAKDIIEAIKGFVHGKN